MDVAPDLFSVGKNFSRSSAEKLESDGLLQFVVAVNAGSDALDHFFKQRRILGKRFNLLLLFLGDFDFLEFPFHPLQMENVEKLGVYRPFSLAVLQRAQTQNTGDDERSEE